MKVSLCMKMNVINMIMLLLISQYMMVLAVNGKDLTCEPGEGMPPTDIRTSGSQCSGWSKITTWQECELAAEYNRKSIVLVWAKKLACETIRKRNTFKKNCFL